MFDKSNEKLAKHNTLKVDAAYVSKLSEKSKTLVEKPYFENLTHYQTPNLKKFQKTPNLKNFTKLQITGH